MTTPCTVLVTCEHARPDLPTGIDLGVPKSVLESHIGYDRGAREIARRLAERIGAPLHLGAFSRLWVDLNRREDNPAAILSESYGVRIPVNAALDVHARAVRLETYHRPYREAAAHDAARLAGQGHCLHLSIHSFDPSLDPDARTYDAGVLFDEDRSPETAIAVNLAAALRGQRGDVRLNEPYLGVPEGLTSWLRHKLPPAQYSGLEIEANQKWMNDARALEAFADQLAGCLPVAVPA